MSAQEWECLVTKKVGDDVSGTFASNAGGMPDDDRFGGFAQFSDNMNFYTGNQTKFDNNWVPTDSTNIRGNPSTNVIDFASRQDTTSDAINFDLWSHGIFPSDTNWTLRWEMTSVTQTFTATDNNIECVRLTSDSAGLDSGSIGEYIAFVWGYNTQNGIMILQVEDTNQFFPRDGFKAFDTLFSSFGGPPWTRFFEIRRTSATTCECTIYSDSAYSVIVEKVRVIFSVSLTNLRFIQITNQEATLSVGGAVTGSGTIDNVQFFNNTEGTIDSFVLHGDEDLIPFEAFVPGVATKFFDFSVDTNWVFQGGVNISGGTLNGWGAEVGVIRRATYDLFTNDGITLSDTQWTVDFDYIFTSASIPAHTIFLVADSNLVVNPNPNVPPVPNSMGVGQQDSIWGAGTFNMIISTLNSNNQTVRTNFEEGIPTFLNTQYFIRFERLSASKLKLSIFSDSARTIHIAESPIQVEGLDPSQVNHTWIHSANAPTGGPGRTLTGSIDNLAIYNGVSSENSLILIEDFSTYGVPFNPDFTEVFNSASGWITSNSTRVRVEEDQGFAFAMSPQSQLAKVVMTFDLGSALLNATPTTFFDDFSTYTTQPEADAVWAPQVVNQRVNIVTDVLDWVMRRDGTDNRVTHDLGFIISDTAWTLRFQYHINAGGVLTTIVSTNLEINLQDTDVSQTSQNDIIGFGLQNNALPTGRRWVLIGKESGVLSGLDVSPSNFVPSGVSDYFVELTRLDATNVRARVYNDSNFSDLFEELNMVTSSANINHRFLIASSPDDVSGWNGTETGFIGNVQFWNGIVSEINDTNWVLRFKTANTLITEGGDNTSNQVGFGISSEDFNSDTDNLQNYIQFVSRTSIPSTGAGGQYSLRVGQNLSLRNTGINPSIEYIFNTEPLPMTALNSLLFVELKRLSATTAICNIYADSSYSNLIETSGVQTVNDAQDLKYLKLWAENTDGTANGQIDQTFDDIQFWNGRSATCDLFTGLGTPTKTITGADDANWVQTGSNVTISGGILSGWGPDGSPQGITYDIQSFDGFTLNDTKWTTEFKFKFTAFGTSTGHFILAIADAPGDITFSANAISFFSFEVNKQVGPDPIVNARIRVSVAGTLFLSSGIGIQSDVNTDLFVRLERVSPILFKVSVAFDLDQTNPLVGSPLTLTDPTFAGGVVGLDHIQSRVSTTGSTSRNITGTVQDIKIFNGEIASLIPWITTDPIDVFVDPCAETIQYNYNGDGSVEGIFRDLITPFADQWVFREKVFFGDLTGQPVSDALSVGHGLSDTGTGSSNDNVNGIFFIFGNSSGGSQLRIQACSCLNAGPRLNLATTFIDFTHEFSQGDTLFVEIVRESLTQARFTLFLDANYTFPIETHSLTISGDITGLRFVQYSGRVLNRDGIIHHTIDDVKIWDGVDVADSFDGRRYLQVLTTGVVSSGPIDWQHRFNLDDSANYANRQSFNGSVDTFFGNETFAHLLNTNNQESVFAETSIYNSLSDEKLVQTNMVDNNLIGSSNPPNRIEVVSKWANEITKISRITIVNTDTGLIDTDTEGIVFGSEQ